MQKLTLNEERSELPHLIIFVETPKLKCSTKLNLNYSYDVSIRYKLLKEIKNFKEKYPNCENFTRNSKFIKELKEEIYKNTEFLNDYNACILERVYYIIEDLKPIDLVCPTCGNKKRFRNLREGFSNGCSSRHANSTMSNVLAKSHSIKVKETLKNKSPEEKQQAINKAKETIRKKYTPEELSNIAKKAHQEHKEVFKLAIIKRNETYKNNPEIIKNATVKAAKTMKNKKIEYNGEIVDHYQFVHLKKLEKDENGLNFYDRMQIQKLEKDENGLNFYDRHRIKMQESGVWPKPEDLPDFEYYRRVVWRYTNKNDLKSLENYDKRGTLKNNGYHLDHIYSIKMGFINNIPAYLIGNISNLRFIPAVENISKNRRCDIEIDDIYNYIIQNK